MYIYEILKQTLKKTNLENFKLTKTLKFNKLNVDFIETKYLAGRPRGYSFPLKKAI